MFIVLWLVAIVAGFVVLAYVNAAGWLVDPGHRRRVDRGAGAAR